MKKLALLTLFTLSLFSWESRGNISLEKTKFYSPSKTASAIRGDLELKNKGLTVSLKAVSDSKDTKRRYIDLQELNYTFSSGDYDFSVGKSIKFWGSLELHNLTDVFNQKDILDDITDEDKKLGSWNISASKYIDDDELSLIVKLKEEYQDYSKKGYTKYFKSEKSRYHPTIFLKYSGSEGDRDFAYILMSGYDSFRDTIFDKGELKSYLYLANKFLTYQTLVQGDTIYKAEFAYTDVKNYGAIKDYYEYGVGVEKTFYSVWNKKDLGVLTEYYKSDINKKIIYQNDLFIGARFSFNDASSSEIVGGVIRDFDSDKNSYLLEVKKRIFDKYMLNIRYIKDEVKQFRVNVGYYF